MELAKKINANKNINIRVKATWNLPPGKLARTIYVHSMDYYFIFINFNQLYDKGQKRSRYPFTNSADRMVNFTLAHEFGHIPLGHKNISDSLKTEELKEEEDLEANEFAGRLLMPKRQIEECSFNSISQAASGFLVSEQALYKRLIHLKMYDKQFSRTFQVCQNCGSPNIGNDYEYCTVCGIKLANMNTGVLTMRYTDGYTLDSKGRAIPCPVCGNPERHDEDEHCRICGTLLYNRCTNDFCDISIIKDGAARYCYRCGSRTTFLNAGILKDWQLSKETLLSVLQSEEDICGIGNVPKPVDDLDWSYLLYRLSIDKSLYLSEILRDSIAKLYDGKIIIYTRDANTKTKLDNADYHKFIIDMTKLVISLEIDEVYFISYQEHMPYYEILR